jgi:acyl carrier protein
MTENDLKILTARVLEVNVLDVDSLNREDFAGWDSLRHIELVAEVEDTFGISLTDEQVSSIHSFADLRECLFG